MNAKDLKKRLSETMASTIAAGAGAEVSLIRFNEHGDVVQGRVTTPRQLTYRGVPALTWEVRERGASGRRSLYTLWLRKAIGQRVEHEAGTITATTVRGNAASGTLQVMAPSHVITVPKLLDGYGVTDTPNGPTLA